VAGTIIFTVIEGFSTIGYGDLSPATDLGKIMTVIYVAGLGIIAVLVSAIATQRLRAEGVGTDD
jgi:hypothetical protein